MHHPFPRSALLLTVVVLCFAHACGGDVGGDAPEQGAFGGAGAASAPQAAQAPRLVVVPDGVLLRASGHLAKFGPEEHITISAGDASSWSWSLTTVGSSAGYELDVPLTEVVPQRLDRTTVTFEREMLLERYIDKGQVIEQQFEIPAPLALDGDDLIIEGAVRSGGVFHNPPANRGGVQGVWTYRSVGITLGDVLVYDADGVELAAHIEVAADTTRIVVDGGGLVSARYPVTIDPEIGVNDARVSDVGTDGDTARQATEPDVAHSVASLNYLVVWTANDETPTGEYEVYGQLLNSSGVEINPTNDFRISFQGTDGSASFDAEEPAVAHNSIDDEYLVVWRGDRVAAEDEIYGQLIDADGMAIGGNFRISDMGTDGLTAFDALDPAVSYNPTDNEYLVVWRGDDSVDGEFDVWAQRITAAGAEIGTNDVQVTSVGTSRDAEAPDVTWSSASNEYLIVYPADLLTTDNQVEVYAQRMSNLAALVGGATQVTAVAAMDSAYDARQSTVAYDSLHDQYLVAYQADNPNMTTSGEEEIFAQHLDATAALLGARIRVSVVGVDDDTARDAFEPDVTYSAATDRYTVVFSADVVAGDDFEIYVQELDDGGLLLGNQIRLSDMGVSPTDPAFGAFVPAVVADEQGTVLVAWHGDDDTGSLVDEEFEIYTQRYTVTPVDDGAVCANDSQCNSGFCIDGVCCESACGNGSPNDCRACSFALTGSPDGICAPASVGVVCRPAGSSCDFAEVCDGMSNGCPPNLSEPVGTACGDQGLACRTDDACDGNGACIDNGFDAAGTACGDATDDECTNADTCNGAGSCQRNDEAVGTGCGDQGVDCRVDDVCTGFGVCADSGIAAAGTGCGNQGSACNFDDVCDAAGTCIDQGFFAAGTTCGNAVDNECTDPDLCDGAGTCQNFDSAAGAPCGDQGITCLANDACDGSGQCTDNGFAVAGTGCGDQGVDCRVDDTCDGNGVCNDNGLAGAGTACGDQGVPCLIDDACDAAGTCIDNGFATKGTACGDQGVECVQNDNCDGLGTCIDNGFATAGTACGDVTDDECTDPDSCNGTGSCQENHELQGTECRPALGDCDVAEVCDGAGSACPADAAAADGTTCDDSDACTDPDVCQSGTCQAGADICQGGAGGTGGAGTGGAGAAGGMGGSPGGANASGGMGGTGVVGSGGSGDGGAGGSGNGVGGDTDGEGDCGCRVPGQRGGKRSSGWFALAFAALALVRRRR